MQLKSISITIFAVLINVLGDGYIIPLPYKVESSNITQLNKNNYRITSFSFAKNIFFEYLTELLKFKNLKIIRLDFNYNIHLMWEFNLYITLLPRARKYTMHEFEHAKS